MELVEEVVEELAAGPFRIHQVAQLWKAEHVAGRVRVPRRGRRCKKDALARGEDRLVLGVVHPGEEAEGHPGRPELDHPVGRPHVGQVVARVGELDPAGRRLEDHVQAGDEHPRRHLGQQDLVRPLEDLRRRQEPGCLAAEDGLGPGHDQRRRDALVGHVADDDPDPAVGQRDEIVEVATDRAGRAVVGRHLPVGQLRQLARQELLLDERRDPHLLLEALPCLDLHGLLAHQLGDPDRRCGLGGERREELAVVRAVLLVRRRGPR